VQCTCTLLQLFLATAYNRGMGAGIRSVPRGWLKPGLLLLLVPIALGGWLIWFSRPGHVKPKDSLFEAVNKQDLKSVQAHVLTGASLNDVSESGHTALFTAAGNGDAPTVKYLLEHGASPNAELAGRTTPLDAGALAGSLEVVTDLIKHGADVKQTTKDGETSLHAAAAGGNVAIVKLLLEKGLDPQARRKTDHATPLCDAASGGHWDCIQELTAHGAKIDTTGFHGRSPLTLSIQGRHREVSRNLIAAGADVNLADYDGIKPLAFAIIAGDYDLVKQLIAITKDLGKYQSAGRNVLYTAVFYAAPKDIIQELLDKGVTPNQINKNQTPLQIATENEDKELIAALKKAGATE